MSLDLLLTGWGSSANNLHQVFSLPFLSFQGRRMISKRGGVALLKLGCKNLGVPANVRASLPGKIPGETFSHWFHMSVTLKLWVRFLS